MADEKDQEKTPVEDKDKKEEKEETTEEDVFSDIFDEEEENKDEQETETEEEKPLKKTPKKTINVDQVVDQRLTAAEQRLERRGDVSDFLNSDQGKIFQKYGDQIRKVALDPRFSNIPVANLPGVVFTPSGYAKILDDARNEADEEAADSYTGGGTSRTTTPEELAKIDPTTMDKKEFSQLVQEAKQGKYKIKK